MQDPSIPSRKQDHVDLVVGSDVRFRSRTNGFERVELEYNALPEVDASEITTQTTLLGRPLRLPMLISAMTGGYAQAESINAMLAEAAAATGVGMSVGSMRAALEDDALARTYRSVTHTRPPLLIANVGAVQLAQWHAQGVAYDMVRRCADIIEADAVGIHLNPLQELVQPEGEPRFRGVTAAIADLVLRSELPIVVKEVGAGISAHVAQRLLDAGVRCIDVAGAGGTSWAGVEILRHQHQEEVQHLWDVGIPTAECIQQCRFPCESNGATLIASGGITNGTEMALAIALGAHAVGAARPILQTLLATNTTNSVIALINAWERILRQWMFCAGSETIDQLRMARVRWL